MLNLTCQEAWKVEQGAASRSVSRKHQAVLGECLIRRQPGHSARTRTLRDMSLSHKFLSFFAATAATAALLSTGQPAHAEDQRPCVSKREFYGARNFGIPLVPGHDRMSKVPPPPLEPIGRLHAGGQVGCAPPRRNRHAPAGGRCRKAGRSPDRQSQDVPVLRDATRRSPGLHRLPQGHRPCALDDVVAISPDSRLGRDSQFVVDAGVVQARAEQAPARAQTGRLRRVGNASSA